MSPRVDRRAFLRLVGLSAAALVTGCGITGSEPDYTIEIGRDLAFHPATLTVPQGALVAWYHNGDDIHTVTTDTARAAFPERVQLPAGVAPWDSGDLYPGDDWVYRFETPGTYVYFCRYHEGRQMVGMILVEARR